MANKNKYLNVTDCDIIPSPRVDGGFYSRVYPTAQGKCCPHTQCQNAIFLASFPPEL